MFSVAHRGFVHVGMDVSKDSISVAVLPPDRDVAEMDRIFNDEMLRPITGDSPDLITEFPRL